MRKWTNNATAQLASGITSGALTLTVASGQGARFPTLTAGDHFKATLMDVANLIEIIKVTARAADVFTIERAQEGTTAKAYIAGDRVELRWTASEGNASMVPGLARNTVVGGGTGDVMTADFASSQDILLENGMRFTVQAPGSNTVTTPTLNVTLGITATGAKTIVKGSNGALAVGDIPGADFPADFQYDLSLDKYVLMNPATAVSVGAAASVSRQSVQVGSVDSLGRPEYLQIGTGLALDLEADPTPIALAFAAGFGANGAIDFYSKISTDVGNFVAGLPPDNFSYIFADFVSATSFTGDHTIVPPQIGPVYNKTRNALLHFEGSDASTSFIDDYGNTWTASGNAQLDTAQFKFGTASLLLDGTGDFAVSSNFIALGYAGADVSIGNGSWTVEGSVRFNVLPTNGLAQTLFAAENDADFGATLRVHNVAGVYQLRVDLSSNGSSNDIASASPSNIVTPLVNVWYHWVLEFDAVTGHYRTYWDGTAEHAISDKLPICGIAAIRIGADQGGTTNFVNGWIDEFRISPCCRYPAGTVFTPSASAFAVEGHWFSTQEVQMYEITSASATPGFNPGMTARNRVFIGKSTQSTSAVVTVSNEPLRLRSDLPTKERAGWVLLDTKIADDASEVDFTDYINDEYDEYVFIISKLRIMVSSIPSLRVSNDGGLTFEANNYANGNGDTFTGLGGHTAVLLTLTTIPVDTEVHMELWMHRPADPGARTLFRNSAVMDSTSTNGISVVDTIHGYGVVEAINAVRFFMLSGNIRRTEIRMYGVRK